MILIFLILLALFQATMVDYLYNNPTYYQLDGAVWETEAFRALRLGESVCRLEELDFDQLTALMVEHGYDLTGVDSLQADSAPIRAAKPEAYEKLKQAYETILGDLVYFPIPLNEAAEVPDVTYSDSWGDGRTYGGDRRHEGCDIMGEEKPRGFYPVVSMSDGVVEKVGWNRAAGASASVPPPGPISTTPIYTAMNGSGRRGIRCGRESSWALWGTAATARRKAPWEISLSTSTWGSTWRQTTTRS